MIYEYILTIEGDYQKQVQCKASRFDEALDIARAAAQAINAVVGGTNGGSKMIYYRLYNQLCAIEAIGVCRQGPHLNERGQRILNYIRSRLRRNV